MGIVILSCLGVVGLIGGVIWLVIWQKKKTRLAIREVAQRLNLKSWSQEDAGDAWKIEEAYQGQVDSA